MEPIFKVGDKVRVKHREGEDHDYDFSFVDDMAKLEGQIFEIEAVIPDKAKNNKRYKCDGAIYYLKDDKRKWTWTSSMLETAYIDPDIAEEKKQLVLNKQE